MRAISLWQPWASAIAVGVKRVETRSWSTSYRGPLAIHAAKRWTWDQQRFAATEHTVGRLPMQRVPLGAIVAVCRLCDVRPAGEIELAVSPVERLYGNYEPGRYGWLLEDVRALAEPVPFLGRQGFFDVPDELLEPFVTVPAEVA
jgi:hypothetical protein